MVVWGRPLSVKRISCTLFVVFALDAILVVLVFILDAFEMGIHGMWKGYLGWKHRKEHNNLIYHYTWNCTMCKC